MSKFSRYQSKKGGLLYPSVPGIDSISKLLSNSGILQNFSNQPGIIPNTPLESNQSDSSLEEAVTEWDKKREERKKLEIEKNKIVRQENYVVPTLEPIFKPLNSNTFNTISTPSPSFIPTIAPAAIRTTVSSNIPSNTSTPVSQKTINVVSPRENISKSELDDNKVKEQIRYYEGVRKNKNGEHVVYLDSLGNKTIGYGKLWKSGDSDKMSEEQAIEAFNNDYQSHKKEAEKIPGYNEASTEQKSALINLTYNMGGNFYKKFPKFTQAMKSKNYDAAAEHLKNSKWYRQVGKRGEDVVDMIRGSKVTKAKFGGYINKYTSGGDPTDPAPKRLLVSDALSTAQRNGLLLDIKPDEFYKLSADEQGFILKTAFNKFNNEDPRSTKVKQEDALKKGTSLGIPVETFVRPLSTTVNTEETITEPVLDFRTRQDMAYAEARRKGLSSYTLDGKVYNTLNDPNYKPITKKSSTPTTINTSKTGLVKDLTGGMQSGGYIPKSQSGGFNMDFLKNVAGNWKNFMKDPFSQQSEGYINDLVGRNKSALTNRSDIQKQLILPDQNYTQWGDTADAAYTQKIWDEKYASQYGKKWNELDTSVQEGIWKDHKYKRPGLLNDDKLGGDLHESGKMFDKDRATRTQLGEANKTFNNQLLETGSGIFSLMNAQKEYDNKPQEKFALDFTDDKGILRSQTGGSIPTSPLGLYKYPGQVVNVPGNDITMKGINGPVIAYPNNDKPELMLPGQNYKFPNSTNVVEVPMSQQGGNTNNSSNMLNKKYGKKVMSYQSGAPVYQGASPRILPTAPILPMGMGVQPKDLEENVKPAYGKSLVDAYKDELKSREGGFDYYQHYMTKGNNNEAFGAFIGKKIANKRERNKLAKLQDQQDKLDEKIEQKASMQSALNKGLNAYRDKQGDQIAAQFRDKNGNLKEVAVGNTANPATRNFVEKLDTNGTIPGTDVTPANTVASKANSSSGSNSSGAYSPYSLPGDKTYEYAKDSNGDWVTRKRGNKEGAYVTLLDNKAAIDKLNKQAVAGDLYAGYSPSSGNSGKSKSTSGSNSSDSSSKFKSPLNTSDYTEGAMVRQGDKYFIVGKNGKLTEEKFDAPKMNTSMGSASPSYNLSTVASTSPTNNSNSAAPVSYFKSKGLPYTATPDQRMLERANATNAAAATSAIPIGKLISKVPVAGKAMNIAGRKVVEVGGKYVDDLGRYVSKNGKTLGNAPKEVVSKTREFFKRGTNPNSTENIVAAKISGRMNSGGKYIDPLTKRFIPSPKDTRGTLQKLVQDSNLSSSFKNTLNSVATTGKRLSKKAYDALSKTEKNSYDKLISEKVAKMQAGGSTFSRENLFNHYYNNM